MQLRRNSRHLNDASSLSSRAFLGLLLACFLVGCSPEQPTEHDVHDYLFQEMLKNIPITFTFPNFDYPPSFHVGKGSVSTWEGEKCLSVPFETNLDCNIDSKWFYRLGKVATFRVGHEASQEIERRFGKEHVNEIVNAGTTLDVRPGQKFHVTGRIIYLDNGSGGWAEKTFVFDSVQLK